MKSLAIAALLGAAQAKCPASMTATVYSDETCETKVETATVTEEELNKYATCHKFTRTDDQDVEQEFGVIYTCTETGLDVQEFTSATCEGDAAKTVAVEYNKCSEYVDYENPDKKQFVKLVAEEDYTKGDAYPPKGDNDAYNGNFDPNESINPKGGKDNSIALKATAATLLALAAI